MYSKDYNLNDEVKALKKLGYDAELVFETELPYDIRSAVKFNDRAQFHPLKFLYKLAEKLKIYIEIHLDVMLSDYCKKFW